MKKLLVMDDKNYTSQIPVFERYAVRAIIQKEDRIAIQKSSLGIYKIPGGGVEPGENFMQALIREVAEETGLIVIPESISEIGEIQEIREDCFYKGQKYIAHSYYYRCNAAEETTQTNMTAEEIKMGYRLEWAAPNEIYKNNIRFVKEPWVKRDTSFIKMLIDGSLDNPYFIPYPKEESRVNGNCTSGGFQR